MKIIGIIPSRYASSRFPGKPLVDIGGKSMIQRVFEQANKCNHIDEIYIATDDERISQHVKGFTSNIIMTASDHQNGTSRCIEAAGKINSDFDGLINIQGDEPFIKAKQLDLLAEQLKKPDTEIATLIKSIASKEEILDTNRVKVVFDKNYKALYFSRSPIPYLIKNNSPLSIGSYYKHIGIYGFSSAIIPQLSLLEESRYESIESLEQLRWLENGIKIDCVITTAESPSIDTPEDLEKIKSLGLI